MYTDTITFALYVSAAFLLIMGLVTMYMYMDASATPGRYAKRAALRGAHRFAIAFVVAIPAVPALITLAFCVGQTLAGA